MIHERFDIKTWIRKCPLSQIQKNSSLPRLPQAIAYAEQIKRKLKKDQAALGPGRETDLCVWVDGEPNRRDITKVGGLPYWPASTPWPTRHDKLLSFLMQFSFVDSCDILPDLPGEILTIFFRDEIISSDLVFFWLKSGCKRLISPRSIPKSAVPIAPCYAQLHRSVDYPDADYELFEPWAYPMSPFARVFDDCTKMGGYLSRIEGDYSLDHMDRFEQNQIRREIRIQRTIDLESFIAQLHDIHPTSVMPLDAPNEKKTIIPLGDMGSLYFYHHKETTADFMCG